MSGLEHRRSLAIRIRDRLFHVWFLLRRPMTLGVRAIVHDKARNAVFLIRHTYVPGWHLPGGGVERGETMNEALERELLEEGDIVVTGVPQLASIHFNRHASPRDHVAVYLVGSFALNGEKRPDMEVAEAGFFALDRLPEGTTPGTRARLNEVFGNAAVSPYWSD
ncbi:MAG: NUDIX domain-containing protein [Notoacmeibacter sp.]|nr:NUDIX domain-containing protein [Notoacmeibacter sp.]